MASSRLVWGFGCVFHGENSGDSHMYDAREMELIGLKLPILESFWRVLHEMVYFCAHGMVVFWVFW